jgi:hypothetical protein
MIKPFIASAVLLLTAACNQTTQTVRYERFDGRAIPPAEMARAQAECEALAEQAASQTPRNYGGLLGDIDFAITKAQAARAAQRGCFARNGIAMHVS